MTVDALRKVAHSLGVKVAEKATRNTIVDELIRVANRRIDKPMDELMAMDREQLVRYFESVDAEPPELLDILRQLDLSPRKESRRGLIELAAREISETGRFQRIAGKGSQATRDAEGEQPNLLNADPSLHESRHRR